MNGSIKELFKKKRKFLRIVSVIKNTPGIKDRYFYKSSTILMIYGSYIILCALFYALYS